MQVNVKVKTVDTELEFTIQPNTTGKQLFDQARWHSLIGIFCLKKHETVNLSSGYNWNKTETKLKQNCFVSVLFQFYFTCNHCMNEWMNERFYWYKNQLVHKG